MDKTVAEAVFTAFRIANIHTVQRIENNGEPHIVADFIYVSKSKESKK